MAAAKPSPFKSKNRPDARAAGQISTRLGVIARIILAIPGGYAVTAIWVSLLARVLPGDALTASLTATMLSFGVCAAVVVGIFAARSALRAALWMGLFAALGLAGIHAADLLRTVA